MRDEWHCKIGDRTRGPLTAAELRELASSGELQPDSMVRRGHMARWVQAARVRGLIPSDALSGAKARSTASGGQVAAGAQNLPDIVGNAAGAVVSGVVVAHRALWRRLHPQRYVLLLLSLMNLIVLGVAPQ